MPVRIFLGAPEELSHYPPSFRPTISISQAPTILLCLLLSSQNPSLPLSAYLIHSPLLAKEAFPGSIYIQLSQFPALYALSSRHQPQLTGVFQSQFQNHSWENVVFVALPRYSHLVVSAPARWLQKCHPPPRAKICRQTWELLIFLISVTLLLKRFQSPVIFPHTQVVNVPHSHNPPICHIIKNYT